MWRKTNEAKPSSSASNTPAPAPVKPQETPQASSESAKINPPVAEAAKTPPITAPAPTPAAPVARVLAAPVVPVSPVEPTAAPSNGGSSTISAGLKIRGEITGTADLVIEGDTQGKIRIANGRVTVGSSGRVNADIDAREIVINGIVQGNLKATESVRLGANSHVEGSVLTPRIGIDDGARLRGNVEMTRAGETPAPAQALASPGSLALESSKAPAAAVRAASASSREE